MHDLVSLEGCAARLAGAWHAGGRPMAAVIPSTGLPGSTLPSLAAIVRSHAPTTTQR